MSIAASLMLFHATSTLAAAVCCRFWYSMRSAVPLPISSFA